MARVYISFLGTNDYLECFYCRGDQILTPTPVRFVQEATIRDNCMDWGPDDRIIIFTTRDAEAKNWADNGHIDPRTCEILKRKGLHSCLTDMGLKVPFQNRLIPEGHTEEQVWEVFQQVFDELRMEDEVVFDITHAFRSIPLLAIVILQYAKIIKKVSLKGIYYGAFEVLGNFQNVNRTPLEDRRAPIVELTALNSLMDWSIATDRFLETCDAKSAGILAKAGVQEVLKKTRGKDEAAQAIKRLGSSLEAFTNMLSTCRGPEISSAALDLKRNVDRCRDLSLPEPFRPLFEKIQERLDAFRGDSLRDGLAAVRWCADHNLIQQGYTILEEVLFGHVVSGVGHDCLDTEARNIASQAFAIVSQGFEQSPDRWHAPAGNKPTLTRRMISFLKTHPDLHKAVDRLRQLRNDLNHAGFCNNYIRLSSARDFALRLRELITQTEAILSDATAKRDSPD